MRQREGRERGEKSKREREDSETDRQRESERQKDLSREKNDSYGKTADREQRGLQTSHSTDPDPPY